jgi:hypothetical protein
MVCFLHVAPFFISTWVLSYLDCYVLPLEFCGAVCVSSPSERKLEIGTNTSIKTPSSPREGPGLIRELVEDWIFPASKLWVTYSSSGAIPTTPPPLLSAKLQMSLQQLLTCLSPCVQVPWELVPAGCHVDRDVLHQGRGGG